jgi:tryptophan-rich sensory protein
MIAAPEHLRSDAWVPAAPAAPTRLRSVIGFVAAMAAAGSVAVSGGVVVAAARDVWVDTLRTPDWTPPTWSFVPMWVAAYLFVGLAGWRLVTRAPGSTALTMWAVSLGLQLAWFVVFFGLWLPDAAFVTACVLGLATLITLVASWRQARSAVLLLLPVGAWIGFIATLNYAVAALN